MAKAQVITIKGIDEIKKAFNELPRVIARKVVRQSIRAAMQIPKNEAQSQWPVQTGASRKSIRVRASRGPNGTSKANTIAIVVLVGKKGKGEKKKVGVTDPWYAQLTEEGWTLGKRIRSGGKVVDRKVVGGNRHIEGRHILEQILHTRGPAIQERLISDVLSGIEREAAKLGESSKRG